MSKKIDTEKVKKYMNRKVLIGASSLLICVALIAVCSFVPFIIDPTRWQTAEFLTDELIIVAIVIFAMVASVFIGQAGNANNGNSNIAKARVKFFDSVVKITNINAFNQWTRKVLQPKDIENMHKRILRQAGVEDPSVLSLEYDEIKSLLEKPQRFNGRYYKGLSKEQINVVIDIKNGKYKVVLVEPEYYLSVKNLIDSRTITERSSKEGLKKGLYLTRSVVSKVVMTVLTAIIFASLMRDLAAEQDIAEASLKFVSRLWSMVSSAFMGYIVGCQINDIDAEYVNMRVAVHNMFLQDKSFVPEDEQAEAKRMFDEAYGGGMELTPLITDNQQEQTLEEDDRIEEESPEEGD